METDIHELSAGYALDALDPADRDAFERHLAGCERCQEELASFWDVTAALAVAADGPAPRPALRDRILADARAERQTVVPLDARPRISPVLVSLTAVAAAVAIGLGIYALSLAGTLDDTRSALSRQAQVAAILADPAASTESLAAGDGRLVVADDGDAVLVVDGLPPASPDETYQVWVVQDGAATSAALFAGGSGTDIVLLDEAVPQGAVVAVTRERAGGAPQPTTDPIAASAPA